MFFRYGPLRPGALRPGLALAPVLLAATAQAATLADLRSKEGLVRSAPAAVSHVNPLSGKHVYELSVWKKGDDWGVISERRERDKDDAGKAGWLAPPTQAQALVARTGAHASVAHVWLKPKGESHWQAYRSDGRKLTPLGATPYREMRLVRQGPDPRKADERDNPAKDWREAYPELVLGIHEGGDAASATIDLIDGVENRVLLQLSQIDLREDPRDEDPALVFRHDDTADGHSIITLTNPGASTLRKFRWLNRAPEVNGFYRALRLDDPVRHGLDLTGKPVIFDRELNPFVAPGLTLGRPEPLGTGTTLKARGFMRVPVTTSDGQTAYQIIHGKQPQLLPTRWREIFEDDSGKARPGFDDYSGHLIGLTMDRQWQFLHWQKLTSEHQTRIVYTFNPASFDIQQQQKVVADSLEGLYMAISGWERHQDENRRRADAESLRWLAGEPERARKRAIERQRQIDEHAKLRAATEAENLRRAEESARAFAARNPSRGSWGNLSPLTLPRAQGARGLSAMEKDYYDNRGNARNPYVVRQR